MAEAVQKRADDRGGDIVAGHSHVSGTSFGPSDLDACLDNRNYRVEYQPKISLLGTQISQFGVEALCRITDPRLGVVSPDKFVPMAETCGLIAKLTDAVVCEAFGAWRGWQTAGLGLRLALNVSPALLGDEEWAKGFLERCAEYNMDSKWVTLEITETAAGATSARACAPVNAPAGPYGRPAPPTSGGNASRELARKILPLVLEGKPVPALALCHIAIAQFAKMPGGDNIGTKLDHLRQRLEEELLTSRPVEIHSSQGSYRLMPRDAVTLGRASATAKADIPVKCRWFGTADKNLRIWRKAGQYFLEDQGSIHGHLVDGARLAIKQPMEILFGRTTIEIRLASGAIAPLSLLLQRNSSDPDTLMVGFDYDARALRSDLGEKEWNEIQNDLACTWIMFSGKFHLGRSSSCAVVLADCQAPIAASISLETGYWIAPLGGASLKVGETEFHNRLPLIADGEWTLAGSLLTTLPMEATAAPTGGAAAARF